MSSNSDAAYLDFLNKANKDYSDGFHASASPLTNLPSAGNPPPGFKKLVDQNHYYTSESDEPFEAVTLPWKGASFPSAEEFASVISTDAPPGEIKILSVQEWDPLGMYVDVTNAVAEESSGEVKVYVAGKGSRIHYFIVGVDRSEEGRLVGFKVLSIES